ncbi:MAG: Crp/Fnr family transcriptional regulator [Acidiferrobacterales bacterium]
MLSIFEKEPSHIVGPSETIFLQGEKASHVYFIVCGGIRLTRTLSSGNTAILRVVDAGELFAEGALFSDRYSCDASVDLPSEIKRIAKAKLIQRLQNDPKLALDLLDHTTYQLHRAHTLVELRNIRSAEERVVQHLRLSLSPGKDEVVFRRPLLQVASDLGLTHEAYYRCLAKLAGDGRIARRGRHIRLLE